MSITIAPPVIQARAGHIPHDFVIRVDDTNSGDRESSINAIEIMAKRFHQKWCQEGDTCSMIIHSAEDPFSKPIGLRITFKRPAIQELCDTIFRDLMSHLKERSFVVVFCDEPKKLSRVDLYATNVLAVTGKPGSGKSTLADGLHALLPPKGRSVKTISFADPIRVVAAYMLNRMGLARSHPGLNTAREPSMRSKQLQPEELKRDAIKKVEINLDGCVTVRNLLQQLGDLHKVAFHKNGIFAEVAMERAAREVEVDPHALVVIDDYRFPVEDKTMSLFESRGLGIIRMRVEKPVEEGAGESKSPGGDTSAAPVHGSDMHYDTLPVDEVVENKPQASHEDAAWALAEKAVACLESDDKSKSDEE